MSTMISSKQMETKLYALVECLADNYGFEVDAAFEFVRWETNVDHVGEILKVIDSGAKPAAAPKKAAPKKEESVKDDASEAATESDPADKIATCRKNIDLWQKKLETAKDADKQREKIEKEQKKLAKLLEKTPEPKKVEAKKPEPKKVEAKKEEKPAEKEKRIKRFSPVMAAQLKTALEGAKVEMTDKLKKEFQQYVEDLADDDFRKEGLADHMRAFAKLKAPVPETVVDEKLDDESEGSEEDAEDEESEPEMVTVKSDSKIVDVTLKELQDIGMTATIDPPGTFWDADNGRFVKGPEADDDEDFEDAKFEGKDYVVGEKTGRVYEARDSGDVFAGFIGVGKFKTMTK